jgi:hypothetical protein
MDEQKQMKSSAKRGSVHAPGTVLPAATQTQGIPGVPTPTLSGILSCVDGGFGALDDVYNAFWEELSLLEQRLRPFLPNHLYEDTECDEKKARSEDYSVASNLNSPTLMRLASSANRAVSLLERLRYLSSNIVN